MANKDERYLNVTIQNPNEDKDEVVISLTGIFKKLKKYFLLWVVTAVVAGVLTLTGTAIFTSDQHKSMTALVTFTYDGIEDGLDPDGNSFDVNTLKTPAVIEAALTELGQSLENLEPIRQGIKVKGIIPSDAIDRITTYQSVYETAQSGALAAAQAMLDVKYFPTQFKVSFNYSETDYTADEAVEVFNTILECYRDYFFETYGYNKALGSAVTAINYTDYDYAEAVDVFDSTLSTLRSYVNNLSSEDTSRFRSSVTGYSFADLTESIDTLRSMDLDILSSYITVNNVTKDKDRLIAYYNYRIETLTREQTIAQETLATITDSISTFEKDSIFIFGNGTDDTNTQSTVGSEQYDRLIQQKINAQSTLSNTTQRINYYTQRVNSLKSKPAGSDAKIERVEQDLANLNSKISDLINLVNTTADDYYSNVSFANAYSVLVPASTSAVNTMASAIKAAIIPALIIEALLFVVYICIALVEAIKSENSKSIAVAYAAAKNDDDDDDNDNDDDKDESESEAKKENSNEKPKAVKSGKKNK